MRYLFLLISLGCFYNSSAQNFKFEKLAPDFTQPVDIATTYIGNDHRLFIVEKTGKIFIIEDPSDLEVIKLEEPFLDYSEMVDDSGEGGLLGLAFHPDYATNGLFFINTTITLPGTNQFASRIIRLQVEENNPNKADINSAYTVISIDQPADNHNGGDLAFGPDGYLYLPMGDGGGGGDTYKNAQNPLSLLGKILRINVDTEPYSIPNDNPFAFDDFHADEIWSLGWRNPWRVAFDRETGDFWAADVGQNNREEINMEPFGTPGGNNYGWNCYEGTENYSNEFCNNVTNHAFPVFEYSHESGKKSVTGGHVYRGTFHPDIVGSYIFSDFNISSLFWTTNQPTQGEFVTTSFVITGNDVPNKITTFGEASDGEMFLATLSDGKVWRLQTDVVINAETNELITCSLSPNPATDVIEIKAGLDMEYPCIIFDATGKTYNESITINHKLDISMLPPGKYYVQIILGNQVAVKQFIKS